MKRVLKRLVLPAVLVCCLVVAVACPAFAVDYEYIELLELTDYVTSKVYTDSTFKYLFEFPVTNMAYHLLGYEYYTSSNPLRDEWHTGTSVHLLNFDNPYTGTMSAYAYPLGADDITRTVIPADDIKEGASFDISFTVDLSVLASISMTHDFYINVYFLDYWMEELSVDSQMYEVDIPDSYYDFEGTYTTTAVVPADCSYFYIEIYTGEVGLPTFDEFNLTVSSLNMIAEGNIFESIDEKLDYMINGYDPMPNMPDGWDSVQNAGDLEDGLLDGASGGLGTAVEVQQGAIAGLAPYAETFLAFAYLFQYFYEVPQIKLIVDISLALGLFATVMGIPVLLARRNE